MSLILDALRRADAERERESGAVPGLYARQMTTSAFQADDSSGNSVWLAVAAALALGGMAAGVWIWQTPASPVPLAAVEPAVPRHQVPAPLAQPVPPSTSVPAAAPPSAVAAPRAIAASSPALAQASPQPVSKPERAAPAVEPQPPPRPKPGPLAKAAEPKAAPATAVPPPSAKAAASQASQASQAVQAVVPLLSNLPEDIRRQIPLLVITGSVYSENPAQRLLLVNNEVLKQGGLAAPGVNLEEIRKKSSVFIFRGNRFLVAH
jgi:general secretion pathway protein B